jgi:hypothetical protein
MNLLMSSFVNTIYRVQYRGCVINQVHYLLRIGEQNWNYYKQYRSHVVDQAHRIQGRRYHTALTLKMMRMEGQREQIGR